MQSSFCANNGCVDVEFVSDEDTVNIYDEYMVAVVHSTDRIGNTVYFTKNEWIAFVNGVKNNEFDWPKDVIL